MHCHCILSDHLLLSIYLPTCILLSNLPPCTGKNVLGTNVTNRLLPVAAQLTHGLGLLGAGFNTIGGVIRCGDIYNIYTI